MEHLTAALKMQQEAPPYDFLSDNDSLLGTSPVSPLPALNKAALPTVTSGAPHHHQVTGSRTPSDRHPRRICNAATLEPSLRRALARVTSRRPSRTRGSCPLPPQRHPPTR